MPDLVLVLPAPAPLPAPALGPVRALTLDPGTDPALVRVLVPVLVVVLACALLAWHLTYTAARLHRLHTRAEGALAALDAQLVRRAEHALVVAAALGPGAGDDLARAADACLRAGSFGGDTLTEAGAVAADPHRAAREDALTAALARVPREHLDPVVRERLDDVTWRVVVAAQVHDDAVDDALRLRAQPLVRVLRLAGHAREPQHLGLAPVEP